MHKALEAIKFCPDCGGVSVKYHFLKAHYCEGMCGKTIEQRLDAAAERMGFRGLEFPDLTEAQNEMQMRFNKEASDEDWAWVTALNQKEVRGWSHHPAPTRGIRCSSPSGTGVRRVEVPPLEIDWSTPGNTVLWEWIVMNKLDRPLHDARSIRGNKNGDVEVIYPWRVLLEKGWNCGICGGLVDVGGAPKAPLTLVFDHIVPVSRGGRHAYENIQPAHYSCNAQKGAKLDGWQRIRPVVKVSD